MKNKVVAITGAGKGIGAACALHLASLGARIVVNNRRHSGEPQSSADRVVEQIVANGGSAVADYSAVEDPDSGSRLLDCALRTFGQLDCVIANAGIAENTSFYKQSLQDFRRVVEINLFGAVNVLHPVFRHMCDMQQGRIILSASTAGLFGQFGLPAYSASKAGLIGLMHSLCQEGARKNVRANAIAPYAATQMTSDHLPQDLRERLSAEQVAPVVSWLASDDCNASGEIFVCGGGRVARVRTLTAHSRPIPGGEPADWEPLLGDVPTRPFSGAVQHFESYLFEMGAKKHD